MTRGGWIVTVYIYLPDHHHRPHRGEKNLACPGEGKRPGRSGMRRGEKKFAD